MTRMIQIRNVPEALHRTLKARAAQAGKSLSDYLLEQIQREAEQPTVEELLDRLVSLPPVKLSRPPAETIREERDQRARTIERRR